MINFIDFIRNDDLYCSIDTLKEYQIGILLKTYKVLIAFGEKQSTIPLSSDKLKSINSNTEDFKIVIDEINHINPKLVSCIIDMDCDDLSLCLHSQYLREIYEKNKLDEFEKKEYRKLIERNKEKTVKSLINEDAPVKLYVKESERDLNSYKGYLPLLGFEINGSAFNVRSDHMVFLSSKFEKYDINVEREFKNMFRYFCDNPIKRVKYANMNRFIINWFHNSLKYNVNNSHLDNGKLLIDDKAESIVSSQSDDLDTLLENI